ncbi:hypothetical protein [Fluviicola sp.]|jgi:hypothetical protein|uniref:hypothetical protein n=1 Tax=Fluviicola sp. TaxID=1917219 RepID=UPI00282189D7|nr:hypothetical protein [Fluviicola sp.]MDR0802576.1 hypothetical protein [Fluviicola sp.]
MDFDQEIIVIPVGIFELAYNSVEKRLEAVPDNMLEESVAQQRIRLYPNPSNDGTFSLKSASEAVQRNTNGLICPGMGHLLKSS